MKKNWILLATFSLLGASLLCVTGLAQVIAFFTQVGLSVTHPSQARLDEIYNAVATRALKPDAAGVVALPRKLASASTDGNAYVTRRGNLLMVLVPTWRGKGCNVQGYLRCNRPLTPADVQKNYFYGEDSVTLFAPGPWGGPNTPSQYRIPPHKRQAEVIIEKKLNNNTFYVFNDLD